MPSSRQPYQKFMNSGRGGGSSRGDLFWSVAYDGAVGDGVADDTAPIQRSIDHVADQGGGVLFFPPGTYRVTATLILRSGVTILGSGQDATHVEADPAGAYPGNAVFLAEGELELLAAQLANNVLEGSDQIELTSEEGLVVGDHVFIWDSRDGSWNPERTTYRKGEIFTIAEIVSPALFRTDAPFFDFYEDAEEVLVYRMSPTTVRITDMAVTGPGALVRPIHVNVGKDCSFERLRLRRSQNALLSIARSLRCQASELDGVDRSAAAGLNYGVVVSNSQDVTIENSFLDTTRHGVAVGGTAEPGSIVNRLVAIRGCTLDSTTITTADLHGNTQFCSYESNTIYNGMNIGGCDHTIKDNTIFGARTTGYAIDFASLVGFGMTIEGNKMRGTTNVTTSDTFGFISYNKALETQTRPGGTMQILDNDIDMRQADGRPLFIRKYTDAPASVIVAGNKFKRKLESGAFPQQVAVDADNAAGLFTSVTFRDNELQGCGIQSIGGATPLLTVEDNLIFDSQDRGVNINAATVAKPTARIIVKGNTVLRAFGAGVNVVGNATYTQNLVCEGNVSLNNNQGNTGVSANATSFALSVLDNVSWRNNEAGDDQAVQTQIVAGLFSTIGRVENFGNLRRGTQNLSMTAITGMVRDTGTLLPVETLASFVLTGGFSPGGSRALGAGSSSVVGSLTISGWTTSPELPMGWVWTFGQPWPYIPFVMLSISSATVVDGAIDRLPRFSWVATATNLTVTMEEAPSPAIPLTFVYRVFPRSF